MSANLWCATERLAHALTGFFVCEDFRESCKYLCGWALV